MQGFKTLVAQAPKTKYFQLSQLIVSVSCLLDNYKNETP